ncbi:pseudouridine synthase [Nitrosomonas sp. Nm132]|uniref:pseudouridine synthase n=1 Tax=Nitrosomonas sp. Nm132 TaxID=1881053 RepID=UPI0008926794|nr:pseudouridine synthase [Nitrosomonas sp. Nm132]SDH68787.1 23S rRNA pseudouridine2457 synthase [Nitrosomonas sp. Nm132]
MARLILFNKPYGVICQFTPQIGYQSLKDFVPIPNFYPAGRLDIDSEGLVLLTDDGKLQHKISNPRFKQPKVYWAQVEGTPNQSDLQQLCEGIILKDYKTQPAKVRLMGEPTHLWSRTPPIRFRKNIPTSWIELTLTEGKNRQVRHMTAAIGLPTLRLIRIAIGKYTLTDLDPGKWRILE